MSSLYIQGGDVPVIMGVISMTLHLQKVYFGKKQTNSAIYLPFTIHSNKGKAGEHALVDSGTTGNFIDHRTVKRLGLGTKKLEVLHTVQNINGTLNGTITRSCKLLVSQGGKQVRTHFYITDLRGD